VAATHHARTALRALLLIAVPVFGWVRSARAGDSWTEVRSPHFVVVSDANAGRAREVGRELERIRAFFGAALPGLALTPETVRVFAVENEKSLASLVPEYGRLGLAVPAGLFRPGYGGDDIAVRVDLRGVRKHSVLYHEYFHLLARRNLGSLPLWLNEGLAQFWGNTVLRGDEAELGLPSISTCARLRRDRPIPLPVFFAVDYDSPYYTDARKKSLFYAQSWALTHYLLFGDEGAHRAQLTHYLERVEQGADPVVAAERAFGDFRELSDNLDEYRWARRFSVLRLPAPAETDDDSLSVRSLSPAEASAVRADFLAHGPSFRDAEPLVTAALGLSPGLPLAHRVMSLLHFRAQEEVIWRNLQSSTSPMLDRAPTPSRQPETSPRIDLFPVSASDSDAVELAYRYAAQDRTLDRALAAIRKARKLDPRSPSYLNDVCRYGSLAGLARAVFPACDAAVESRPADGRFRESRAVARSILGDVQGAVDDLRVALADESLELTPDERAERRLWIRRLEAQKNPFDEETRRELLGPPF
jgi:hypothetical protein